MTPPKLAAKEFEELLLAAAKRVEELGITMSRYGVMATLQDGKWTPLESLPDFEGVFRGGQQFIIEAKVNSQASFPLEKKSLKPRQVAHMLTRAKFGVPCWLVLHWNERILVNRHDPGETIAIPIDDFDPRWRAFVDAYAEARRTKSDPKPQGSISRVEASRIGTRIEWVCPKGSRKFLPDLAGLLGVKPSPSLL